MYWTSLFSMHCHSLESETLASDIRASAIQITIFGLDFMFEYPITSYFISRLH